MIAPHIASWALGKDKQPAVAHVGDVVGGKRRKQYKKKERVLQMGGGGSRAAPAQPSPQEQAAARDWEAQQAEQRNARAREAEDARRAIEEAASLESWRGSKDNAYAGAQDYGRRKLSTLGLDQNDPYGIWSMFTSQLDQNKSQVRDNQDFSSLISNSVFDTALADARSTARSKYGREFKNGLGTTYLDDTFNDKIDDSILDAILGEQYTEAEKALMNSRDRGEMNQFAYDRSVGTLGKEKEKARGELETTGRGVISGLRDRVGKQYDDSLGRANNFDFGDTYDVGSEIGRVKSKATDAISGLDSELRRAIGGKEFFDPTSIKTKSIAYGGASNYTPAGTGATGSNPLYSVFDDQARKKTGEGMF